MAEMYVLVGWPVVASVNLELILPLLSFSFAQVPFSPQERLQSVSKMYSVAQRYGAMGQFLTISFDDAHNPLVLRASVPSLDNTSFPAVPGDFMETLHSLGGLSPPALGPAGIELGNMAMHQRVAKNPVAATMVFLRKMKHVCHTLLGKPLDSKTKTSPVLKAGILGGTMTAMAGCIETQGRGTLHAHMLLCGLLGPDVIQACALHPRPSG
jgi:hypothetical protein